jgi:myo-inositol-hexaphosphate 3-phosphohydrolase
MLKTSVWGLVVLGAVLGPTGVRAEPAIVSVAAELTEDGHNYDDPCFWQDPHDGTRFLAFMTDKDDALLDVWEMPSRTHIGRVTGFKESANNCDVDQRQNLLVATDPGAREVLVFSLPSLREVARIRHDRLEEPSGVAVGHSHGQSLAFVTDEDSKDVHVFQLPAGTYLRSFPYNLKKAEGIATDDDLRRVYVSDDKSDARGTKAFTFEGTEISEFGVDETGTDSEGTAVYRCGPRDGYIIVSDQRQGWSADSYSEFEVFDRQTFQHLGTFRMQSDGPDWTGSTDGIDVFQGPGMTASGGIFAACDGCGRYGQPQDELDIVGWDQIAKALGLRTCPNGQPVAEVAADTPAERPVVPLVGTFATDYRNRSLEPRTVIDAGGATFLASPSNRYPLSLGGGEDVCIAGGSVLGQYDRTWSWDRMHDMNNAGLAFENPGAVVDGIRIENVTDGIRPRPGAGFTIRNAWLSYIRDDCIENDHLQGGLVDHSLLDGCYVAFSARPSAAKIKNGVDGSGDVWTIQKSLVRLQAMPGPRGGDPGGLGHGSFFKWHSRDKPARSLSPKLALYDNIFMAESAGQSAADRLAPPPGKLVDCANNVMVWAGPGEFPATLPSCFTVTKDRSVWDRAVAEWVEWYRDNAGGKTACAQRTPPVLAGAQDPPARP